MPTASEPKSTGSGALDAYLDGIKHLPPPPTLMIQLINLFRQQDADLDEIVALLRRDPALSAEVLRRCNNSFMEKDEAARDITEAVFCLGFYETYQITVSLFSMRMLSIEKEAPRFPAEQLRRHSSITGIAAGELALELDMTEGLAFTAGLLHDIGKLALALGEGEKYANILKECEAAGTSLSEAEKKHYGFDHTELGGRLLERWGVPEDVVAPALGHNDPAQPGEVQAYVVVTNLASRLAHRIGQKTEKPVGGPFSANPEVKGLMEALGLDDKQMLAWEQQVRKKVRELPGLMLA